MNNKTNRFIFYTIHNTIFGEFLLASSELGLVKVNLPGSDKDSFINSLNKYSGSVINNKNGILEKACTQLDEYLSGEREKFTIPIDIQNQGTEFQNKVWRMLISIPYGKTLSYKDVALKLNNLGAIRAVGQANKKNPVAIFIPCHRVIGTKKGDLGGYAGKNPKNIDLKGKLLNIELKNSNFLEKYLM